VFEIAHEWLESIPDIRIVCNVDLAPEDLKVAQLREARMLGRWNERSMEAESLLNRERYQRPDAFLAKRVQVNRVAPDSVCGFVHGKAARSRSRTWITGGNCCARRCRPWNPPTSLTPADCSAT
jgi:hypothetical protein